MVMRNILGYDFPRTRIRRGCNVHFAQIHRLSVVGVTLEFILNNKTKNYSDTFESRLHHICWAVRSLRLV